MRTIGIDIGGTQLRAAALNDDCTLEAVYKTDNDRTLTCQQNVDKILKAAADWIDDCDGIGIGSPGPLNTRTGTILSPPNMYGWDNFAIVDYIEEKTGIRAVLTNDANVGALAEATLGSGAGYESVVYVTISTGIGGGFVYGGQIVSGANCNAAELWNMIVSDDTHCHRNANPGSLNEQSSGSGLAMWATEHYGKPITAKELFEYYNAGDTGAVRIVEHGAEMMARGFANIMCTFDPDVIVVGGSVARHNPHYLDMSVERTLKYLAVPETLRVKTASFGDDAGLIGAALLARSHNT